MTRIQAFSDYCEKMPEVELSYKASVIQVNIAMLNIQLSNLPTLYNKPANWDEIVDEFQRLKDNSFKWIDSVLVRLKSVPAFILDRDTTVVSHIDGATKYAIKLERDPYNQDFQDMFIENLDSLMVVFDNIAAYTRGLEESIHEFQLTMVSMLEGLEQLLINTKKTESYDKKEIKKLEDEVNKLQKEINEANKSISQSLGIAGQTAIAGGVLSAFGGVPGKVVGFVFFGVSLFFGGKAVNKTVDVVAKNGVISVDEMKMDHYTQDVAILTIFTSQIRNILDLTQQSKSSLAYIAEQWEEMSKAIGNLISETKAIKFSDLPTHVHELCPDLYSISSQWIKIIDGAALLELNVGISKANLELGMNDAEITHKINTSPVIDNIEYFRNAGVAA